MKIFPINKRILSCKWPHLLTILLIGNVILLIGNLTVSNTAEYKFTSMLYSAVGTHNKNEHAIIEYNTTDINRASLAGLVQSLIDVNAKSILLDIDLSQSSAHPFDDSILSNTLQANSSSNIVIPIYKSERKTIRPLSTFRKHVKIGFIDYALDESVLNKSINLKLNTASTSYPHAVILQLGKQSSGIASTYLDPAFSENIINKYLFNEIINSDAEIFKNKHIIIGPSSKRNNNHALLLETLKSGKFSSIPAHILLVVFFILSLLLINLFSKNENRSQIFLGSTAISVFPLILNYITLTFFRTLFPSLLLFMGLVTVTIYLTYFHRRKLFISIKSFNLENERNNSCLNKLLEGEISVDKDGVILKADSIASRLLGVKDQDLINTPLREIAPSIQHDKWQIFYGELTHLNKSTEHLFEIAANHSNGKHIGLQLQPKNKTYIDSVATQFILRNTMGKTGAAVALEYQAKHDKISRTLNKDGVNEYLEKLITETDSTKAITTLLLRIVNLQEITSTLGQESTEKVIRSFATSLYKITDDSATVGRLENTDFLVIFNHQDSSNINTQIAKVLKISKNSIHTSGISVELSLHAGIAIFPEHGGQANELIKSARLALVSAVHNNKKLEVYKQQQKSKLNEESSIRLEMHTALKEQQFKLFYQPIINLSDNGITTAEALLRWDHPNRGLIRPSEFIDQIEHSKLVRQMTKWVINTALSDARKLGRYGINASISVNISERNLLDSHFPTLIEDCITKNKMRASNIEFEISEKKLHLIPEQALKLITKLKENNIKFTLDNYGAENMSLLNLRQLPFSKIKINRTLISKVIKSTQDEIVIDAIIRLAHGFGISVVAEGIESELHYNKLKQLGCDYCQGHLFSKPVTINNLIKLFKTWDNTMDDSQKMPAQTRVTWNGQYNSN